MTHFIDSQILMSVSLSHVVELTATVLASDEQVPVVLEHVVIPRISLSKVQVAKEALP